MKVIYTKRIPKGFIGFTIWPFIFTKIDTENDSEIKVNVHLRHEIIHCIQQKELLLIPFFVLYFLNYAINLIIYRNSKKAYRNICFEKECYKNQNSKSYISNRKPYSFINYLK